MDETTTAADWPPAFPWSETIRNAETIRGLARKMARPELRDAIRAEYARGTASEIGALYGMTRNAIIGIWHRAGLKGARSAPKPTPKQAPARRPDMRVSLSKSGSHEGNIGEQSRGGKGINPPRFARMVNKPEPRPAAPPAAGPVAGAVNVGAAPAQRFSCVGVDFLDLQRGQCKYEVGPAFAPPQTFKFCGNPVAAENLSWCLHHFILTRQRDFRDQGLKRIGMPKAERERVLAEFEAQRRAA